MRIVLSAIFVGAVVSLGLGGTPAYASCDEVVEKAKMAYGKVRHRKEKGAVKNIKNALDDANKALAEGNAKACRSKANKALKIAKKFGA